MIAIGMMDRKIVVQGMAETKDTDYGGLTGTAYSEIESPFAHIIWNGGKEGFEGEQFVGQIIVDFYIRHSTTIADMDLQSRIYYGGEYYYVETIDEIDGRLRYLRIRTIKKNNRE